MGNPVAVTEQSEIIKMLLTVHIDINLILSWYSLCSGEGGGGGGGGDGRASA